VRASWIDGIPREFIVRLFREVLDDLRRSIKSGEPQGQIVLIENFFEELERLVPVP